MAEILLDTNFIMTCVKQKIDFFDRIEGMGFRIFVPKQVILELERVANKKNKSLKNRELAEFCIKVLEAERKRYVLKDLGRKHVDKLIVKCAKEHPKLVVATLDRELKKKLGNSIMVIRDKKRLEVI